MTYHAHVPCVIVPCCPLRNTYPGMEPGKSRRVTHPTRRFAIACRLVLGEMQRRACVCVYVSSASATMTASLYKERGMLEWDLGPCTMQCTSTPCLLIIYPVTSVYMA